MDSRVTRSTSLNWLHLVATSMYLKMTSGSVTVARMALRYKKSLSTHVFSKSAIMALAPTSSVCFVARWTRMVTFSLMFAQSISPRKASASSSFSIAMKASKVRRMSSR